MLFVIFRYPGLTRRTLTNDERKKLIEMGHSQHVAASSITLLVRYPPFLGLLFKVVTHPITTYPNWHQFLAKKVLPPFQKKKRIAVDHYLLKNGNIRALSVLNMF